MSDTNIEKFWMEHSKDCQADGSEGAAIHPSVSKLLLRQYLSKTVGGGSISIF